MSGDGGEFNEREKKALKRLANGVIEQWPSRRDVLKLGAFGGASALMGAGMSGGASAQSASGQIGTAATPVDDIITNNITDGSSGNTYDIDTLAGSGGGGSSTEVFASNFGSDGAAIQSALDDRGDNPSAVHFDVEVSTLDAAAPLEIPSNTTVLIEENITLAGGAGENLIQTKGAWDLQAETGTLQDNIKIVGASGVLDGNKANQGSSGNGTVECCLFIFGTNVTIEGVVALDSNTHNVHVMGESSNIRLLDCLFENGETSNVQAHYKSTGPNPDYGDVVTDCRIEGCTSVGGGMFGLKFSGVNDGWIEGCAVTQSGDIGILVKGGDDPDTNQENVHVEGNVVHDNAGAGIEIRTEANSSVGDTERVVVAGNTIGPNNDYGIVFSPDDQGFRNCTVEGNTISGNGNTGIILGGGSGNFRGLAVTSNTVSDNDDDGIAITGDEDECVFSNNVLRNNSSTNFDGSVGANSVKSDNVDV